MSIPTQTPQQVRNTEIVQFVSDELIALHRRRNSPQEVQETVQEAVRFLFSDGDTVKMSLRWATFCFIIGGTAAIDEEFDNKMDEVTQVSMMTLVPQAAMKGLI